MKKKYTFIYIVFLLLAVPIHAQSTLKGDINEDGAVDASDIACLVHIIKNPNNCHEYVDLGIKDSEGNCICFATMNLGAKKIYDFGDFYAWGETNPKEIYARDWSNYFDSDNGEIFQKYSNKKLTRLEKCDDAASVKWGGDWRMPSYEEMKQLKDNCLWEWTTINGVNGYTITATNGNHIFLPATGFRYDSSISRKNIKGVYWTSTLHRSLSTHAYRLWLMKEVELIESSPIGIGGDRRFYGEVIRPVITIKKN